MSERLRYPWPVLAAAAFAALTVGAMWLPWFRSGSAGRNSFALFRAAQLLGIDWITPLRVFWFLLPVIFLCGVATAAFELPRLAAGIMGLVAIILSIGGALILVGVGLESGPAAAAALGLCTTVCCALGLRRPT